MRIPFVGPTYQGRSLNIDASRCVNFFLEMTPDDEKTPLSLIGTPGTTLFATIPQGPIRGAHTFNGLIYFVAGSGLYSISSGGTQSSLLGTLTTLSGRVSMADNGLAPTGGNQLMIADGSTSAYIFNVNSSVFTTLGSGTWTADVVAPQTVTYIGGNFIVTGSSSSFQVSALYDGTTWSGLDVEAKSINSDLLLAAFNNAGLLWLFGSDSTEVWQQTTGHPPFAFVTGSAFDYGLAAQFSIAKGAGTMFWLANIINNGKGELLGAVMGSGFGAQVISTPAINWQWSQYSTVSDAWGYCFTMEGHLFYVLTFPTANATWVYDFTTQMWFEWSTYVSAPYAIGRHYGNAYASLNGKHYIGDYQNGNIYQLSSTIYQDNGNPIVSMRTSQHTFDKNELNNTIVNRIQIDAETGVGDNTTLSPQASLAWSLDGGHTYSNDYQGALGPLGQYKTRLLWRRLGIARERLWRLICSDPVKKVFMNAYVNGAIGSS